MKGRIVIYRNTETSEYYKLFPDRKGKKIEHIEVLAPIEQNVRFEQVPENWDDFLELCKTLKKVFISANEYYVEFNKLKFYMDGTVEFNGVIIKIIVGVSRMWQIIKNLVGENEK